MSQDAIVKLRPGDLVQLEKLLASNDLPVQDCAAQADSFYAIYDQDELIAAAGLEPAEDYALLRSLVVDPRFRGRGLARKLSRYLLEQAESRGLAAVYLLTETAADYFEKLGFVRVQRGDVPASIARTRQFSTLCPDSARCLMMTLS